MKAIWLLVIFVVGSLVYGAAQNKKLWVTTDSIGNKNQVIFIQDLETGTRCYAVTSDTVTTAGYAISCVGAK